MNTRSMDWGLLVAESGHSETTDLAMSSALLKEENCIEKS